MSVRFTVIFSKLAQEKFDEFIRTDHKVGKQIGKAVDRLAENPDLGEFLKGEREGYRKYRTGNYRIIYRIERNRLIIFVVTIDDRKDVYR
jgi:mRNA interferase RelE/StbE